MPLGLTFPLAMAGGWASLPADLLKQVSGRLASDADHLHTHQVCAHWRSSTSLPAAYRPWVVAGRASSNGRGRGPLGEFSLWLPRGVQRVDLVAAPPGLPCCCGTPRGWLALADDARSPTRLVLWEPLSGTEIPLPCPGPVIQVFLSGDPLASSDWMAVATRATRLQCVSGNNLFFWRPGDAAWSGPGERCICTIRTVAFHAGRIYCIDEVRNIAVYDLKLGTASPPVLIRARLISPVLLSQPCARRCDRFHGARALHLVTCNGELLLVLVFHARHPSFAEVYKPEWLTRGQGTELGERMTDLGGYSLFVGWCDAFALSAEEFPAIKRNCVYYVVQPPTLYKQWAFVFDLESDALEEIPCPQVHKEDWLPYSWYCPERPFLKQQ